jgi:branched-chain amino acid aminotransferase
VSLKVSIDGVIQDGDTATIPVTDRGFLYGDSVYEVVRTYHGRPFAVTEHLERLQRSADRLAMPLPGGLEPIAADIDATLAAAGNAESYVRVIVTRGSGPIGLDPGLADHPRRVVIVAPFTPFPAEMYRTGVTIHLVASGRAGQHTLAAGAKSGNYLINVLAVGAAREQDAHEAILMDQADHVTEGASSNLFMVRQGQLLTPPLSAGILEGITRHKIFELAEAAGFPVQEQAISGALLREADEIFLTSTLRELMPVVRVDDWTVAEGRPGTVTQQLLAAYREAVPAAQ